MEWPVIHEIVYGLIVLTTFLVISWYLYYSLQNKQEISRDDDQFAANLPETPQTEVETQPPTYEEAANTHGLRHRNSMDANLTYDNLNINNEESTGSECTRVDCNRTSHESIDASITSDDVNCDNREDTTQLNSEEASYSECKKGDGSNSNNDQPLTGGDSNTKFISGDESIRSKEDDKGNELFVQDGVSVQSDAEKCNNEDGDKSGEEIGKKLDTVKDERCGKDNIGGEANSGEGVCHNDDRGVDSHKCEGRVGDVVSSISSREGESVGDSGDQYYGCEDFVSVSSKHDTDSLSTSSKYDTASGGSGVTME